MVAGYFTSEERFFDHDEALRQTVEHYMSRMFTAMPVIEQGNVDPKNNTINGNVALKLNVVNPDGTMKWQQIPQLQ